MPGVVSVPTVHAGCWCGRSAGGSPSPGCWSQGRCRGCAGCSTSTAAAMPPGHEGGGTGPASQVNWKYWCWAGHTAGWDEVEHGTWPGSSSDSPLIELSTNLREDSVAGKVGGLYKEKAPVGAFSGHYETSRRFVDGSTLFTNQPWHNENAILYVLRDLTILGPY